MDWREKMAYWLDYEDGEWGFAATHEEYGLHVAQAHAEEHEEYGEWVDHFVELMEGHRTTRVIEGRAEFEFLYRCLERVGKPLAFSPIVPNFKQDDKRMLTQAA